MAKIDGDRLLDRLMVLADSARTEDSAITRLAWSAEDHAARHLIRSWVDGLPVITDEDAVGNVTVELPGEEPGLAPIVTGSHLDTVEGGGPLDGAYGVVAAIEVVTALASAGERLRHPLRAVAWVNEEGVVAPPFTGSIAATGGPLDLDACGPDGVALRYRLSAGGGDPAGVGRVGWGPVAAYVELHIEQGPVLDHEGVDIGVVTAIAGSQRGRITATGQTNHAGTTPMHLRRDALVAVAPLVATIEALANRGPADVATAGLLTVEPGNGNVVPGQASLSYDIRSTRDAATTEALDRLRMAVAERAAATGVGITVGAPHTTPAVPTDPGLQAVIRSAAEGLGHRHRDLPSGAGHDAQHLTRLGPMAMIFVPSAEGVSHSGAETTPPEALVAGSEVLLETLRRADAELDQ